jgi:hypothetical protein
MIQSDVGGPDGRHDNKALRTTFGSGTLQHTTWSPQFGFDGYQAAIPHIKHDLAGKSPHIRVSALPAGAAFDRGHVQSEYVADAESELA